MVLFTTGRGILRAGTTVKVSTNMSWPKEALIDFDAGILWKMGRWEVYQGVFQYIIDVPGRILKNEGRF